MAVVGAGGWLGFSFYAKHRVTAEVETAFEQIRKQGGKASYGKIAFDLPTRTLTIEDIAVTPGKAPQAQIRIAAIKGTGVRQIDETRISADAVDIIGLEVTLDQIGAAKLKVAYKIPHLVMRDYAGPVQAGQVPADSSLVDMYRYVLGQYASVAASSLTAPTLTISFDSRAAGSGEVTYSELAIQNLKHGKIDGMKSDRAVISVDVKQPGKTDKLTGESSNIIVNDFDATAIIAALDPQTASDDSYRRVYRQVSTGPYALKSAQGMRVDVDGFTMEDIAVQPSKFRLAEIFAALPRDQSAPPTPAQARELLEKLAGVYEGLRIGKAEIGKMSVGTPQGTATVGAIRFRDGEFAVEGVDAPSPQGQFKMERFALKSFSTASLMRWAASLTTAGRAPSPDQMLGLFGVLAGAEIKGVTAPFKTTNKLVMIDTLSLDWGAAGRLDPEQGACGCQICHASRSIRSKTASIDCQRDRQARYRPRSRRCLDRTVQQLRSDARDPRHRRHRKSATAYGARQRTTRGVFGRSGPAHGPGGPDRGGHARILIARQRRHRSRRGAVRAHAECQP